LPTTRAGPVYVFPSGYRPVPPDRLYAAFPVALAANHLLSHHDAAVGVEAHRAPLRAQSSFSTAIEGAKKYLPPCLCTKPFRLIEGLFAAMS
jgi:hypothetical protein